MTPAAIITLALLVSIPAIICAWYAVREYERTHTHGRDFNWIRCGWCGCYYHAVTRTVCMRKPYTAPVVDSHGICFDCDKGKRS